MEILREPIVTLVAWTQFQKPPELNWETDTDQPGQQLIEMAGRTCYQSWSNPSGRTNAEYIGNMLEHGHLSVIEHASATFYIRGVSRSLTHELVRHRHLSFCLTGDTLIYSDSPDQPASFGHGSPVTHRLDRLYDLVCHPSSHGLAALRRIRVRCLDEASGTFTRGRIRTVLCSGVKPVFRVELEDGKAISCSRDHRFLTPEGWRSLARIVGGLEIASGGRVLHGHLDTRILVNGVLVRAGTAAGAPWNRDERPTSGWAPTEDHQGSVSDLRRPAAQARLCTGSPPWLPLGRLLVPCPRKIVRVLYAGEQVTYDLVMEGPHHNFVANGIVTHNSQESQRYVPERDANFIEPDPIAADPDLHAIFLESVQASQAAYNRLLARLEERFAQVEDPTLRRKLARQAARSVMPNCTETQIVVTGNLRAWRDFIRKRATEHADPEIRRLAVEILRQLRDLSPAVFSDFEIYRLPDGTQAARTPNPYA